MGETVERVRMQVGRGSGPLTRRDVARALLARPPAAALEALPDLRAALEREGQGLSEVFWDRAEEVLHRIAAGEAAVGEVRAWLEATGTEPTEIVGFHVWDEEPRRSPLARELHALLVAHLEGLVESGDIDPDALLRGDEDAVWDYVARQEAWLSSRLPDGRVPAEVLFAEDYNQVVATWTAADRTAAQQLAERVAHAPPRPCPVAELEAVMAEVGPAWAEDPLLSELCAVADVGDGEDADAWLCLVAGVVAPARQAPAEFDVEEVSGWYALEHVDWLAVVDAVLEHGPGLVCDPASLAGHVADYAQAGGEVVGELQRAQLETAFALPVRAWHRLGVVDVGSCLTPLGFWGLPEALGRAWSHE